MSIVAENILEKRINCGQKIKNCLLSWHFSDPLTKKKKKERKVVFSSLEPDKPFYFLPGGFFSLWLNYIYFIDI